MDGNRRRDLEMKKCCVPPNFLHACVSGTGYSGRSSWTRGRRGCAAVGCRVSAGSVWVPPAGSDTVRRSDDVSSYWIGQAILGFTNSHKFGFTKVSGGGKRDFSIRSAQVQHVIGDFT